MRSCPVCLLCLGLLLPATTRAQEPAEWTTILLLSANYDDMEEKLSWTGSSAEVNVVVLHDNDGFGLRAYTMLPDTNSAHEPGECCPGTEPVCCASAELPLGVMGLNAGDYIYEPGVLSAFFAYVAAHFPAQRYLVSLRGQMSGGYLLQHDSDGGGMTVDALAAELDTLTATVGHRVDLLNLGFCLSSAVDWAHALATQARYLVVSSNYTNPPVASRWRFYAWARQLIRAPATGAAELAVSIPDEFAITSDYCSTVGHHCLNTNPPNTDVGAGLDEPWAVAAIDLDRIEPLTAATRALACAVVADFTGFGHYDFEEALEQACVYGRGYTAEYKRPDLGYLAELLARDAEAASVRQAAAAVSTALQGAVLNNRHQTDPLPIGSAGWFANGNHATGLTAFVPGGSSLTHYRSTFGDFQLVSAWRLLVETRLGVGNPTVTGLTIQPAAINAVVGDTVLVTALPQTAEYGTGCAVAVDWNTSDILNVGELVTRTNPATFRAELPGSGTLIAQSGNRVASIPVTVRGRVSTPAPEPTPPSGCDCDAIGGPFSLLGLVALFGCGRRRRGAHRDH